MAKQLFVPKDFQAKTLELINHVNGIVDEYTDQGFVLTLRQLYYQLVARIIVENTVQSYKRVGSIVNDARLAGLVDWDAIEDRTRNLRSLPSWADPADIIDSVSRRYREDLWLAQSVRIEVWIEKDALLGVIERICHEYRVPFFACRGNNSQSEQYKAGQRFAEYQRDDVKPIVLHLGDHDPNGIDMTRDNRERLATFAGADVEVRRIALNIDQCTGLPPNPAKETDSRFDSYVRQFDTTDCWELDALDPVTIEGLVRTEIEGLIDMIAWDVAKAEEEANRGTLAKVSENWAKVENLVRDQP